MSSIKKEKWKSSKTDGIWKFRLLTTKSKETVVWYSEFLSNLFYNKYGKKSGSSRETRDEALECTFLSRFLCIAIDSEKLLDQEVPRNVK